MIKGLFEKIFGKRFNSKYVKNSDSNNVINSGSFVSASINNGNKEVYGHEINISNTGNNSNIYVVVDELKKGTLLSNDIEKIKKMENYSFSTKAI